MRGVELSWRNWLLYIGVILVLALFYVSLSTVPWMKRPFGPREDVEGYLDDLIRLVDEEQWDEAGENLPDLEEAWDRVIARLQLVLERDEVNRFTAGLVRLKVAVEQRDATRALTELAQMRQVWQDMGR
ncbi:MAG: DUF4363 family protein [Bacillota bacterium]